MADPISTTIITTTWVRAKILFVSGSHPQTWRTFSQAEYRTVTTWFPQDHIHPCKWAAIKQENLQLKSHRKTSCFEITVKQLKPRRKTIYYLNHTHKKINLHFKSHRKLTCLFKSLHRKITNKPNTHVKSHIKIYPETDCEPAFLWLTRVCLCLPVSLSLFCLCDLMSLMYYMFSKIMCKPMWSCVLLCKFLIDVSPVLCVA